MQKAACTSRTPLTLVGVPLPSARRRVKFNHMRHVNSTNWIALGLVVLSASGGGVRAQTAPASLQTPHSWLQFRNDTVNAGVVPGTLDVTWKYRSPRPVRGIAVAEGTVLIGTESADAAAVDFAPDQHGFVVALDVRDGHVLWTQSASSWVHGDPVIYEGKAYVAFGRWPLSSRGGVTAFDLRTGRVLWSKATTVGNMPGPAIDTVTRSIIVVGGDAVLYELSLDDGTVRHATGLRVQVAMSNPRLASNHIVYVAGGRSLISYSELERHVDWRVRNPPLHSLGDVPVALGDTTVFTTGYAQYSFWAAARDLPLREFIRLGRSAYKTRRLADYKDWFQQQWLLAFDRRDGHLLWGKPLGIGLDVPRNASGMPVLVAPRVIVTSPVSRTLWVFDAATGRVLSRRELAAVHKGAVTAVGDDILLGDRKGNISLFRLPDGAPIGQCFAGSAFNVFGPRLVGKTLFVGTDDGWLHAVPYDSLRRRAVMAGARSCF